jgi:hypothetical protein
MIVDFAVEHEDVAPVAGHHRLAPALDVDDAEAPHPEAEVTVCEHATVVWSSMGDRVALAGYSFRRNGTITPTIPSRNSAHLGYPIV